MVIESANLPLDAIVEILARLPIKSIIRFKSVCKAWHQLFSTADFIRLYHSLRRCPEDEHALVIHRFNNHTLLLLTRSATISRCSFQFLAHGDFRLMASSNGLLCFRGQPRRELMYVCNPMTRQFRRLPDRPRLNFPILCIRCDIAFDSLTLSYKVIYLASPLTDGSEYACQVFDSMTDSWHTLPYLKLATGSFKSPSQGVFCNGFLYFMTFTSVIALDWKSGLYTAFPLPEHKFEPLLGCYLLELNGSPSLLVKPGGGWMNVWVLSHSTSQWTLVERVKFSHVDAVDLSPMALDEDTIFMKELTKMFIYHRGSQVWERIDSYGESGHDAYGFPRAYGFKSTLFPCHR